MSNEKRELHIRTRKPGMSRGIPAKTENFAVVD
jgi:hypothetical protein